MLKSRIKTISLVKVVIPVFAKEGIPLDPEVEDFMRRFRIRHGGTPQGEITPMQELEEFKSSFFGFLNNAGIDSMHHEFIELEDGFIIVITVAPEDAVKIEDWYSQNS